MTEGIVASGGEVGKDACGFLRDAVAKAMSSPEARAALAKCGSFMEFEGKTREALHEGASAGTSDLLTEADAERLGRIGPLTGRKKVAAPLTKMPHGCRRECAWVLAILEGSSQGIVSGHSAYRACRV